MEILIAVKLSRQRRLMDETWKSRYGVFVSFDVRVGH